ncbi:MAG: hypothetical protein QM754_06930 [Tepidisphaeraceae bacterium]
MADANRTLTPEEHRLARWMLEHGNADAAAYLEQLDRATVKPDRCKCGCASINFDIEGLPTTTRGVHILGDFVFDDDGCKAGIFIFSSGGILSGIEVWGMEKDAPKTLPAPEILKTL